MYEYQASKSAVLSAVYTTFVGVTLYWDWDDRAFDAILSSAQLPPIPQPKDVAKFLVASHLLAWRLATDGGGVWLGHETASTFVGQSMPWQVDCWFAPEKAMSADAVVAQIMRLAAAHPELSRTTLQNKHA